MKKRILTLIMSVICLLAICNMPTFATPNQGATSNFDIVKAKQQLVAKANSLKDQVIHLTQSQRDYMLAKMVATGESQDAITLEMAKYGVYYLDVPLSALGITPMSVGTTDISFSQPSAYYDSNSTEWIVVSGGHWNDDNWTEHIPSTWCHFAPSTGQTCDIGGDEGFGTGYTSIDANTYSSSINSVYAYIGDGEGHDVVTTTRSDGDGSKGFGFRIQDKVRIKCSCLTYTKDTAHFSYIGKYFSGLAHYTSAFGSFDAVATGYLIHTYSSSEITGITFGESGKSAGISFTVSDVPHSFPAYSSDLRL